MADIPSLPQPPQQLFTIVEVVPIQVSVPERINKISIQDYVLFSHAIICEPEADLLADIARRDKIKILFLDLQKPFIKHKWIKPPFDRRIFACRKEVWFEIENVISTIDFVKESFYRLFWKKLDPKTLDEPMRLVDHIYVLGLCGEDFLLTPHIDGRWIVFEREKIITHDRPFDSAIATEMNAYRDEIVKLILKGVKDEQRP
jgi:hypothetical protein